MYVHTTKFHAIRLKDSSYKKNLLSLLLNSNELKLICVCIRVRYGFVYRASVENNMNTFFQKEVAP